MASVLARLRLWRFATHPAVALPLWLASYFAWHVPPVYDAALQHQSLADPCRARVLLRYRPAALVAARAGHPSAARRQAHERRTRSRPSCSPRRSGSCSPCCRARRTRSTSHARPRVWGLSPARRPADRGRDDGERAGDRALRRLRILVPAIPRRGGRYLRQLVILARSTSDGCSCHSMTAFPCCRSTSSMPTFRAWKRR